MKKFYGSVFNQHLAIFFLMNGKKLTFGVNVNPMWDGVENIC